MNMSPGSLTSSVDNQVVLGPAEADSRWTMMYEVRVFHLRTQEIHFNFATVVFSYSSLLIH